MDAFENSFYVKCPDCGGTKTVTKKCSACLGAKICRYGSCKGGRRIVRAFREQGGDHYEVCHKCHGSGVCQNCRGQGVEKAKCYRCNERGLIFDRDSAVETYHRQIEHVLKIFP